MTTTTSGTAALVGSIRRFGPDGVLYQVVREMNPTTALIHVLETGEELVYPTAKIKQDPIEE